MFIVFTFNDGVRLLGALFSGTTGDKFVGLFTFKDGVRLFSQDIGESSGVRLTGDKFVGLVHF